MFTLNDKPPFRYEECAANEAALESARRKLANEGYKIVEVNRGQGIDMNGLTSDIYQIKAKRLDPDKFTGMEFAD